MIGYCQCLSVGDKLDLLDLDQPTLIDLLNAAHYLDIHPLLALARCAVGARFRPLPKSAPVDALFCIEQAAATSERRVVATKPIKRGDVVMQEYALAFCAHPGTSADAIPDWCKLQQDQVKAHQGLSKLCSPQALWGLVHRVCVVMGREEFNAWGFSRTSEKQDRMRCHSTFDIDCLKELEQVSGWSRDELIHIESCIAANCFALADRSHFRAEVGCALFGHLSFVNHSCVANMRFYPDLGYKYCDGDQGQPSMLCIAARDIKAGEELTIPYYGVFADVMPSRIEALPFAPCHCLACTGLPTFHVEKHAWLKTSQDVYEVINAKDSSGAFNFGLPKRLMNAWRSPSERAELMKALTHRASLFIFFRILSTYCYFVSAHYWLCGEHAPTPDEYESMVALIDQDLFGLDRCAQDWLSNRLPPYDNTGAYALQRHMLSLEHGLRFYFESWVVLRAGMRTRLNQGAEPVFLFALLRLLPNHLVHSIAYYARKVVPDNARPALVSLLRRLRDLPASAPV